MPLYTLGNRLVVHDGALAANSACCCDSCLAKVCGDPPVWEPNYPDWGESSCCDECDDGQVGSFALRLRNIELPTVCTLMEACGGAGEFYAKGNSATLSLDIDLPLSGICNWASDAVEIASIGNQYNDSDCADVCAHLTRLWCYITFYDDAGTPSMEIVVTIDGNTWTPDPPLTNCHRTVYLFYYNGPRGNHHCGDSVTVSNQISSWACQTGFGTAWDSFGKNGSATIEPCGEVGI
jgi:hypothetical protein